MAPEQRTPGIGLVCSRDGAALTILRDEIGLPEDFLTGSDFDTLAASGSQEKCLNFLKCVWAGRAAFDWEMDIRTRHGPLTMFFFGMLEQDRVVILGATTLAGAVGLASGLLAEDDAQVDAVRNALKRIAAENRTTVASDRELFNELTRLNNELADAQRALAKSNVELDRLNREKVRFMGIAAHDLRNSIAIVQTYSEFVLEENSAPLRPELMEFLSIIRTSSEAMLRLIDDLLDISVIESGALKLELKVVDLSKLLGQNLVLNRILAARKNVRIDLEAPYPSCTVRVDSHRIEQVLNNLISNAVKFSPPEAVVTVGVEIAPSEATIHVIDRGPGIPNDELEHLFRPFRSGSARAHRGERSAGLGLAIVKSIVEGHGGRVWIRSAVGAGSTFSFSVPVAGPSGADRGTWLP